MLGLRQLWRADCMTDQYSSSLFSCPDNIGSTETDAALQSNNSKTMYTMHLLSQTLRNYSCQNGSIRSKKKKELKPCKNTIFLWFVFQTEKDTYVYLLRLSWHTVCGKLTTFIGRNGEIFGTWHIEHRNRLASQNALLSQKKQNKSCLCLLAKSPTCSQPQSLAGKTS